MSSRKSRKKPAAAAAASPTRSTRSGAAGTPQKLAPVAATASRSSPRKPRGSLATAHILPMESAHSDADATVSTHSEQPAAPATTDAPTAVVPLKDQEPTKTKESDSPQPGESLPVVPPIDSVAVVAAAVTDSVLASADATEKDSVPPSRVSTHATTRPRSRRVQENEELALALEESKKFARQVRARCVQRVLV